MIYENKYQIGDQVKSTIDESKIGYIKCIIEKSFNDSTNYSYLVFNEDDKKYFIESERFIKLIKRIPLGEDSDSVKKLRVVAESHGYKSDLNVGDIVTFRNGLIGQYAVSAIIEMEHGEELYQYELVSTYISNSPTKETYVCGRLMLEFQYHDSNWEEYFNSYYCEMATIAIDEKLNINVNPEIERLSIAYFKVLNAESFRKATKVAKLHFKDSGMEYYKDKSGKQPWILNSKELRNIIRLLKEPNDSHDGYTNWQIACYQWNLENGLIKQGIHDYFSGKYDHMYDNDSESKEAYVPSTQEMPETWKYESK